ncbi:MAG TPA: bifunctional hydroxymethylpyrimidine kinase/phosphomethylpyrimidine kinase [Nitrospirae bacterium]|nr:bifunctional hydroxymethylpyrimidine kinase/phosphomethylpyrimidine kinase [Nitrospirota bacterium]
MSNILSIAGFDPTSGAGTQADLKVFARLGAYGLSVATSITIQDSRGVYDVLPIDSKFFFRQLSCLANDFDINGIKIGMVFSPETVLALCKFLESFKDIPVIYDPVISSSTGYLLMKKETLRAIIKNLIPLTTVITPNIKEAEMIIGKRIKTLDDLKDAVKVLHKIGANNVIITGGHFDKIDNKQLTLETIYDGKEIFFIKGKKLKGEYHGTGCVFSSALTFYMTEGFDLLMASKKTRRFVYRSIKRSQHIGEGMRLLIL